MFDDTAGPRGRAAFAAIALFQSRSLCGICGKLGILAVEGGVAEREPLAEDVWDEFALPVESRENSTRLGERCGGGDTDAREVVDVAGDTLRGPRALGRVLMLGGLSVGFSCLEDRSRSSRTAEAISGVGRSDLSMPRGRGREVAVSVCRLASRFILRTGGALRGTLAKSTTEVEGDCSESVCSFVCCLRELLGARRVALPAESLSSSTALSLPIAVSK